MADTSQLNPSNPADHLTTLPSEVLQNIASYLYATHIPDKALIELGLRRFNELPSSPVFPPRPPQPVSNLQTPIPPNKRMGPPHPPPPPPHNQKPIPIPTPQKNPKKPSTTNPRPPP
ncbi:hypothetical protein Q7P36_008424 [Cladosporium allicinum]